MKYIIDLRTFDFDVKRFQRRLFNRGFTWIDSGRTVKDGLGIGWRYIVIYIVEKIIFYDHEIGDEIITTARQFLKDLEEGKI